ncbi:hypothetical protein [Phenylobacterium sp.]|uniref:hypothetical protein n=1 Tax=Phenylobacterium sp. TaxID=1871053 RepID=UPI0035B20D2E
MKAAVRPSVALRFRREIEAAEAAGVARGDMRLLLTLGELNQLRRDASVGLEDISFAGGVMRYLGVEVQQGGVAASSLQQPGG